MNRKHKNTKKQRQFNFIKACTESYATSVGEGSRKRVSRGIEKMNRLTEAA